MLWGFSLESKDQIQLGFWLNPDSARIQTDFTISRVSSLLDRSNSVSGLGFWGWGMEIGAGKG
jgi:hypothetical protein